jgi:hypothetical protein
MKELLALKREMSAAFTASLLLVISGPALAYLSLKGIREPLILHFSTYTGINQIGGLTELFALGLTALIVVLINAVLAFSLEARQPVLGKVLAMVTVFLALLLFIGFMAIISVNS